MNMRETEHEITFETSYLLTSRINPSILYRMVRTLSSSDYPTMVLENIQIYNVQTTGERIYETPP